MRAPFLQQALLVGICIFTGSCSTPDGTPPPSATSVDEQRASANPPSAMSSGPSIPAASTSFPTWRPPPPPAPVAAPPPVASARASSASSPASRASMAAASSAQDANLPSDMPTAVSKNEAEANFDNLEIVDASLKGKLAILRVGSSPNDNHLLSVFAGLKNETSKPLALEIQTLYKDKLGNPLNDGSWIPMTLKPHEETEYHSSSISVEADADQFLVRIRRASTAAGN